MVMALFCLCVASLLWMAVDVSKALSVAEKDTMVLKSGGKAIRLEELVDSFHGLAKLTSELKETVDSLKSENAMILDQLIDLKRKDHQKDVVIQDLKEKIADLEPRLDGKDVQKEVILKKYQHQKRNVHDTGTVGERKQSVDGRSTRLVMDSQGPVVAFYATLSQETYKLGSGQNIVFDHALTNLGNAYHAFHGIFTAPYKGLYMFSGTIGSAHRDNLISIDYVLNGSIVARTRGHDYDMGSHTMFLVLNKGDDFSLQSQGNMGTSSILGNTYSSFTGRLVALLE